ncbi:DUF2235 domain-containing protein [Roseiarcaceae bacterium H3SJ34-1]|uniref:DUF2235 domain-containing protein n=1 Tax=Terripilifer ovatus TaxID=3032367 RepID=UPI003AB937FD|nr:DUF2235 domain-containing protein [Roseiarcaceae bacterium H3SJ34-1]
MAERIVILSDGTGNAASSVWRTNVWRIFQSLDLQSNAQAAKYDDGVGTSSFLPLALLGGAFGWGLKRNVLDTYKFVCRNYESGARLYLFGFSRGAFTVRVLTAFILQQGLVKAQSDAELHDLARKAYRAYRANGYHSIWRIEVPFRWLRDKVISLYDRITRRKSYDRSSNTQVPNIEFLGIWDTVAAYGLPVDEMTRGVSDWIWPLRFPDRILNPRVLCARHAVALDDERTTFHPLLWTEQNEPGHRETPYPVTGERLAQVWFTGMHSNVGGGYPDDALAFVPLYWILEEAKQRGLVFKSGLDADPDTTKWIRSSQDKDGRLYDSRSGLGGYYRYGPRKLADLCNDVDAGVSIPVPKIHHSVFGRIDSGCNSYAPIGLPEKYAVVAEDGLVAAPSGGSLETPAQAAARHSAQERLWNYVWLRRLAYFATLAATFHLVAFWLFHPIDRQHEYQSSIRLVSEMVRAIESLLPRPVHWWADRYAANPEWFLGGIAILAALLFISSSLSGKIKDTMRQIWLSRGATSPVPDSGLQRIIYNFRSHWLYRAFIRIGRLYVLPFLFALAIAWVVLTSASHLLFNLADSTGAFCKGTTTSLLAPAGGIPPKDIEFDTKSLCAPTGVSVRAGVPYNVLITVETPWKDKSIDTSPAGYGSTSQPFIAQLKLRSAVMLRRILFRPWYMLVARVGETGVDEYFLDPVVFRGTDPAVLTYRSVITPNQSGEVFFYVNDAVIALPWVTRFFYWNNAGTAKVRITPR